MSKVLWGVIGTGFIASKVVELAIQKAGPDHEVIAVGSRSIETANKFASKLNIKKSYGSYDEVLADTEVTAVYIALPTSLHKEYTIKAANAKKHILCEKPLAPTTADAEEMLQACKANNVLLMDATFWVHHSRTQEITSQYLTKDTFTSSRASFTWCGMDVADPNNIRFDTKLEPSGVVGDMLWYSCGIALWGFQWDLPEKVIGYTNQVGANGNIMDFHGTLYFSNNRVSHIEGSFVVGFEQSFQIKSRNQSVVIDDFVLPFGASPEFSSAYPRSEVADYKTLVYPSVATVHHPPACVEEIEMIRDFGKIVKGEDKDAYKWIDNCIKNVKVLEALLESAKTGSIVTLKK